LRLVMKHDGRTRYALAKAADLPQSTLHRMVHEGTGLNIEAIERLADVLGFKVRLVPKGKASTGSPQDAPQEHDKTQGVAKGGTTARTRQAVKKRISKGA
jgi:hypothetical protein